ncbi:MAG: FecR domain-containing protein [Cyclobacteriaceae bacterium]|nr:FecR domain-containing protein [Cyclobacteriaceae bacterium HetDA_MAG_MS6]
MANITEDQLVRYFKDECDSFEKLQIEEWLADSENAKKAEFVLQRLWSDIPRDLEAGSDLHSVLIKIHEQIEESSDRSEFPVHQPSGSAWRQLLRIAAIIIIPIMSIGGYYLLSQEQAAPVEIAMIEKASNPGQRSRFTLPDGSKIWLSGQSQISFPETFDANSREINLKGEAFFDVVKDPDRPFIVHTRDVDVKVFGTSFNVSAYPDDKFIQTTVATGLVGVKRRETDSPEDFTFIKPDQQMTFTKSEDKLELSQVDNELYTSWINGELKFRNARLDIVTKKLSRWYGLDIELDPALTSSRLTFTLKNESLQKILTHMKSIIDLDFEIADGAAKISKNE